MSSSSTSLFSNFLSVFKTRIAMTAIGFVTGVIVARNIGPEGKGLMAILLVYPTIVVSLFSLGIRQTAAHLIGQNENLRQAVFGNVIALFLILFPVGMAICLAAFIELTSTAIPLAMILLACLFVPAHFAQNYAQGIFIGLGEIRSFNRLNFFPVLIGLLSAIILVWLFQWGLYGVLTGILAAGVYVFIAIIRLLGVNFNFHPQLDGQLLRKMLRLGIVFGLSIFMYNCLMRIDQAMLGALVINAELGQYALAVNIAEILWKIPAAVGVAVWVESAGTRDRSQIDAKILRAVRLTLLSLSILAILLYAAAPFLIPFIYGIEFSPSVNMVRLLLPGIVAMALFNVFHYDLTGRGTPKYSLSILLPTLILNIGLNLWWIPGYGARGAAVATSISYGMAAFIMWLTYARLNSVRPIHIFRFTRQDFEF